MATTIFYTIISIHDIPYEIAKHRNHPQQHAIHLGGWVSLFTLHLLWPFMWIRATLCREDRGRGSNAGQRQSAATDIDRLEAELKAISQRLAVGDEAEAAFDALPGQVFEGRVKWVLPLVAEGQLQATADLIEFRDHADAGRVPVALEITDPEFAQYDLPDGVFGQSAIYTEHAHDLAVSRSNLPRMASWLYYFIPFH